MSAIYGLYDTPDEAQYAVNSLRSAGYTLRDITILSSEPLEEYEFAQKDRETWMPKLAAVGGLVGGLSGISAGPISPR